MQIVARGFTVPQLASYVQTLTIPSWPKFVVVHNTSSPTAALYQQWQTRAGWTGEQWMHNLASYYAGQGFPGGPHFFVAYNRIWALNPLQIVGTHSPSWNHRSWGIETVGEFMTEPFDNGTRDNLIATLGILHMKMGWDPGDYQFGSRGLHFHKEDPKTTHKECPGRNIGKARLVADVQAYILAANPGEHHDVPAGVHEAPDAGLTVDQLTSGTWLQISLNRLGTQPALQVDNRIGPATKAAVKAYQQLHGLVPDGIAGPLTRASIRDTLTTNALTTK